MLGSTIFLVDINDLPNATVAKSILYADDSNCLFKGSDLGELKILIESELRKISIWFRANKLQISAPKSQFMLFIPQRCKFIPDLQLFFNLNEDGENDSSKIVPLKRISAMWGDKPEDKSVHMLFFFWMND